MRNISKTATYERALLEDVRRAIRDVRAPFACGGTFVGFVATLPVIGIPLCFSPDCEGQEERYGQF